MYAGTVADFSATDPLILKRRLRTEQYDLKHLNEPHFVNSLEDEDHVYFFFRESAIEFMNCGKVNNNFFFLNEYDIENFELNLNCHNELKRGKKSPFC